MAFVALTQVLVISAIFSAATFADAASGGSRNMNIFRKTPVRFECTVRRVDSRSIPGHYKPSHVECVNNSNTKSVKLDGDLDTFFGGEDSYIPGITQLSIPASLIVDDAVDLSMNNAASKIRVVTKQPSQRKIESPYTGTYKVLVVRVKDTSGDQPSLSIAELGTKTFDDTVNLKNQFAACSGDQLNLLPATGKGIFNGVAEVTLTTAIKGRNTAAVAHDAVTALPTGLVYDLVMVVEPSSASWNYAVGMAYFPGTLSWYKDYHAVSTSVSVHEIGHNLGMHHSNLDDDEYEDATCVMGGAGYFDKDDEKGEMCFNAAKSHYFGWFSQYHNDFTPAVTGYSGELVSTNDVAAGRISTGRHYILKLSGTGETDLFVYYNKAEGITKDMDGRYKTVYGNAVMVYSQASLSAKSSILAGLTATGHTYTKADWAGSRHSLKIEVCSITAGSPDMAKVIVYVDGVTTASCAAATSAPTATSPSAAPVLIASAPIAVPDSSPLPKCQDIAKSFEYNNGKSKNCKFVSKKNTELRCNRKSALANCPVTCGDDACQCYNTAEPFKLWESGTNRNWCTWAESWNTDKRCRKNKVRANCPVTCGVC